jgi:Sec-independent protein secretion pathway component TatC
MAAFSPTMAMNMVVHPLQRHIKEIKRRLLVVGATIMVFFVVAFTYSGLLIEWFNLLFSGDSRQRAHDSLSVLEIYRAVVTQEGAALGRASLFPGLGFFSAGTGVL